MIDEQMFEIQPDYEVPLLRLMSRLPGGQGKTDDVCRLFEAEYGHRIPQEHYEGRKGQEAKWRLNVRWCRKSLVERGYFERSAPGIWKISDAGREWLEKNPGEPSIPGWGGKNPSKQRNREIDSPTKFPTDRESSRRSDKSVPIRGINLEMLEQTRAQMPHNEFRRLWGPLYDQLLAKQQDRIVTKITQTELGRRCQQRLVEIHTFLQGKSPSRPSSAVLCDWIQFCYVLELHPEAAALLTYIGEDEVDPAIYKRAKRMAEVSRSKLSG